MFGFPFFAIFVIIHTVCIISPCLSPDFGSSYDILDLADVVLVIAKNVAYNVA